MPNPELLSIMETAAAPLAETAPQGRELSTELVDTVIAQRTRELEALKPEVSLKFYYAITKRIKQERSALEKIFHGRQRQENTLSHYSFVLDPRYFEQRFLTA